MLNLRTMNAEDLPVFKKWLRMPHVAKWDHEPLDWIEEVESRTVLSAGFIILSLSMKINQSASVNTMHVKTVMNYGEDTRKWADLTASII